MVVLRGGPGSLIESFKALLGVLNVLLELLLDILEMPLEVLDLH